MSEINRFSCGNGEGMFENKKGYWVSYEEHKKEIKKLEDKLNMRIVNQQRELLKSFCDDILTDINEHIRLFNRVKSQTNKNKL